MDFENHLSDEDLVMAADGELPSRDAARVSKHLAECWSCRARKQELDAAAVDFVRVYKSGLKIPAGDGPRAMLRARLSQEGSAGGSWWARAMAWRYGMVACVFAVLVLSSYPARMAFAPAPALPQRELTPGAVIEFDRAQVCGSNLPKNSFVPASTRRRVFAEYGIVNAPANAYEVDYLITPALGGADDIHNLWPQPYASGAWNARVKDALEDRMREMVCRGDLDLATAQREIATDWIAAYKKYFHTDQPLDSER